MKGSVATLQGRPDRGVERVNDFDTLGSEFRPGS